SYVSGTIDTQHVYFTESGDGGTTWSTPRAVETGSSDHGYYTAPAISPDGHNVYVVYNAFTTPYQNTTSTPRVLVGGFIYATASRTYGAAVWNDTRLAADCPAIDAWRMSLRTGGSVPRPAPLADCTATFGNSDIFGTA